MISFQKRSVMALALCAGFLAGTAASATCVPTRTVEEAKRIFAEQVAALNGDLRASDAKAMDEYMDKLAELQAARLDRQNKLTKEFDAEWAAIVNRQEQNWHDQLDQAVARYNQSFDEVINSYNRSTELAFRKYNTTVESSRFQFRLNAQAIADEYNRSVCAE